MTDNVIYTKEQMETLHQIDREMEEFIDRWKKAAHREDDGPLGVAYRIAKEAHKTQFRATGEP